jgi:hypothetical protein
MRKARMLSCAWALGGLGLATGCSSPVSPASQGALSVYLANNAMAGSNCSPAAHWVNVPYSAAGGQQTNASNKGNVAVDGVAEMGVSCAVKDNGSGGFAVSGTMKSPAFDAQGVRRPTSTLLTFSTTIAPGQAGAQGQLTLQDDKTGPGSTYQSDACIYSVNPAQPTDHLEVAPGKMWAQVICPIFRDPLSSDINARCQIETGYIVLENCAQ